MSSYSVFGALVGLLGAAWFGWRLLHPLPTTNFWPGGWYTKRSLSLQRLKLIAVTGILQSLGVIGISFYPAMRVFVSGMFILLVGSLVQAVVLVTAPVRR